MLILTRKRGTEIVIDGRIRLTVLRVGGDRVQLGISAPATVPILRRELLDTSDPGKPADPRLTPRPARPAAER